MFTFSAAPFIDSAKNMLKVGAVPFINGHHKYQLVVGAPPFINVARQHNITIHKAIGSSLVLLCSSSDIS